MGLDSGYPDDKLPQCWSDDVRMNALFAPFRLKSANPESWEMKMKFWSDMLRQWCRFKVDPIVSAADVRCVFQRRGRTAACIDIVIEEMFRSGELSPITKYHQILHNGPEGWVRWGARLAFRPAVFALTAVTSLLPARQATDSNGLPKASIDSTQRFVLESAVKDQATEFLNNFPPTEERIGTIEELMRISGYKTNREIFEIYLGYLVSQGMAIKNGDVIKLAEPNKKVTPVTELDEALVKLMSTETRLSVDMARLSREVDTADIEARAALKLGNKLIAKNHLRKKLKAQQRLDRCESALENIRELVQQARNTDTNTAVVDTYRKSAQAMKRTMKDEGLEDSVYNTMDNLKEVMDSYNEVQKALGGNIDDLDTTELEQELNDLLAGSGNTGGTPGKEEGNVVGPKLPSPPVETPKKPGRKPERDFVFDGEEQMLADLNKLGVDEASSGRKVAIAEKVEESPTKSKPKKSEKPAQDWDTVAKQGVSGTWSNKLNSMAEEYGELRQDNRLHPGQPLDVDFSTPPQHYSSEFQVRDHKAANGVWLFNSKDDDNLTHSTEYCSSESPGKSLSNFQMAPGGERKKPDPWPKDDNVEDLERRLKNLRGFNL